MKMKPTDKKIKELLQELEVYVPAEHFSQAARSVSVIPTGSPSLDEAVGIGGYPEGKIVEIFGVDSSGKTTLALHALREAQRMGKVTVYIDLENTINLVWAKTIGVDVDRFYIARPRSGEAVFELLRKLTESGAADLIVVDSVSALVPMYELDNTMEDQQVGLHARLMSKGLRIVQSTMIGRRTTIIFINQVRDRMGGSSFLPSVTTTGGRALRYAAGLRIEVKRAERIVDSSGRVQGFETRCSVVKNKFGSPMVTAKTAIYFDSGFDAEHEIIMRLIDSRVLTKKGPWLEFEGKNIAQGLAQLRAKLKADAELRERLRSLAFPAA